MSQFWPFDSCAHQHAQDILDSKGPQGFYQLSHRTNNCQSTMYSGLPISICPHHLIKCVKINEVIWLQRHVCLKFCAAFLLFLLLEPRFRLFLVAWWKTFNWRTFLVKSVSFLGGCLRLIYSVRLERTIDASHSAEFSFGNFEFQAVRSSCKPNHIIMTAFSMVAGWVLTNQFRISLKTRFREYFFVFVVFFFFLIFFIIFYYPNDSCFY